MKSIKKHVRLIWFRTAFNQQFVSFLLLIGFLNTVLFPSVLVFHRQAKFDCGTLCNAQLNTSLAEYLLEDCLDIYDPTLDNQEEDINNLENLYDELDLVNPVVIHEHLSFYAEELEPRLQCHYPLLCSYYNSVSPPPEHLYL